MPSLDLKPAERMALDTIIEEWYGNPVHPLYISNMLYEVANELDITPKRKPGPNGEWDLTDEETAQDIEDLLNDLGYAIVPNAQGDKLGQGATVIRLTPEQDNRL